MDALVLSAAAQSQLTVLNLSGVSDRQLAPVALKDGTAVLPADLLTDLATWQHYAAFLSGLPRRQVDEATEIVPHIIP